VGDEAEGFWIVMAAADKGLVDIHDRRPLFFTPHNNFELMDPELTFHSLQMAPVCCIVGI
jgi:putative SOS response-associated peptidase YedK